MSLPLVAVYPHKLTVRRQASHPPEAQTHQREWSSAPRESVCPASEACTMVCTDCESLKLGCPPWKVIWTEMTPAALIWERGQRVYHPWNRNQARRPWREWSSQRVTLCLANFFLPLGKRSSSKPLPVKVAVIGGRPCFTPACHGYSYLILIGHYRVPGSVIHKGIKRWHLVGDC